MPLSAVAKGIVMEKIGTLYTKQTGTGGPKSDARFSKISHALRNLDDRIALNRNPLSRLAYVQEVAKGQCKGSIYPCGLALRKIITSCIDKIVMDLGNEPKLHKPCKYLSLMKKSMTCRQISNELGISREHLSRVYRRRATELLVEEFYNVIKENQKTGKQ